MYTQKEQTDIVRDAMLLTTAIEIEAGELQRLYDEEVEPKPKMPRREIAEMKKIELELPEPPKKEITQGIFEIFGFVKGKVSKEYANDEAKKRAEQEIQYMRQFEKYKADCEEVEKRRATLQIQAEEENKKTQALLDEKYEKEKANYMNEILPNYNKRIEIWQKKQGEKIDYIKANIELNKSALNNLYETTKLISSSYRDRDCLEWLYEDIKSSDHDIRYATELYDRYRERVGAEKRSDDLNRLIAQVNESIEKGFLQVEEGIYEGNLLALGILDNSNSIKEDITKIKRIAMSDLLIGAYQRYLGLKDE